MCSHIHLEPTAVSIHFLTMNFILSQNIRDGHKIRCLHLCFFLTSISEFNWSWLNLKLRYKDTQLAALVVHAYESPTTQLSSRMLRWHLWTTTGKDSFGEYQTCVKLYSVKGRTETFESLPRWITTIPLYIKLACQGRCLKLIKLMYARVSLLILNANIKSSDLLCQNQNIMYWLLIYFGSHWRNLT